MTDITQADRDELRLWIEDGCPEGVAGIPEQLTRLLDDHEAAFQAGVKAGLEAAAADIETWFPGNSLGHSNAAQSLLRSIRAIDPTSIKDTQP